jgi:hypothetical protein
MPVATAIYGKSSLNALQQSPTSRHQRRIEIRRRPQPRKLVTKGRAMSYKLVAATWWALPAFALVPARCYGFRRSTGQNRKTFRPPRITGGGGYSA